MYRVPVTFLEPGMRVGRSVVDAAGRILLTAGTVIRPGHIPRLQQLAVPAVYIWNELAPDVVPPDVVSAETRQRLTRELREAVTAMNLLLRDRAGFAGRRWAGMPVGRLRSAVNDVVDEVLSNPGAIVHLQEIGNHDEAILVHSVNVCVLCTLTGATLGYDVGRLRDLALGAVLHDVGKITVSRAILDKPGGLNPAEWAEIQAHPQRGFEILTGNAELPAHSAVVALQHHERWAGGGYPLGLKGSEINELARVAAIADVYDAMASYRPYRPALTPDQVTAQLRDGLQHWFEPDLLQTFLAHVAPYPIGSLVELDGGEVAVVVAVAPGCTERPRVRVVRDPTGHPLASPYEIDLNTEPPGSCCIQRVLAQPEDAVVPDLEPARRGYLDTEFASPHFAVESRRRS